MKKSLFAVVSVAVLLSACGSNPPKTGKTVQSLRDSVNGYCDMKINFLTQQSQNL